MGSVLAPARARRTAWLVAALFVALVSPGPGVATSNASTTSDAATAPALARVEYNDPNLVVDLGVGLWAWPIPMDFNGNGLIDLVVSTPDTPFNGLYFFENTGDDPVMPTFKPPVRISHGLDDVAVSHVQDEVIVTSRDRWFPDFIETGFQFPEPIPVDGVVHDSEGRIRGNQWSYVDYNGNGALDLVVGIGDWSDYGWDDAYDDEGNWTNGPLHGYVYLIENTGTTDEPDYTDPVKIEAGDAPIDVYGAPSPVVADFNGDGKPDIITGEFLDRMTFFENVGTRTDPEYAEGVFLRRDGRDIRMDLQMIVVTAVDWTGNGHTDLVVGQEDGRVALVENTGALDDGMPVFEEPRFFQQEAQNVKIGALATPDSFDWDGDGYEDLIVGDTAGRLSFIKNLDGGDPPTWAPPEYLEAGGEEIRIQAGENGSIQGPAEAKWGYTTPMVVDWNHDGLPDILINSIWGEVLWYENIGTRTEPELAAAQPIEVAWEGDPLKPEWNWWDPVGNQLVTQWRTTPFVTDLNDNGLNDLVMLDHEGYLAWFERREVGGELVLEPGKRVFVDTDGAPLRLNSGWAGRSGRRKLTMTDWTGNGHLDLIVDSTNAKLYRNVGDEDRPFMFEDAGQIAEGQLAGHTTSPTIVDWNNDGVPDLLIGGEDGHLYHIENNYSERPPLRVAEPDGDLKRLVGAWEFDEGEGNIAGDGSGYANYGVVNGASWVEGYTGSALHFDGFNDYVSLDYTVGPHLDGAPGITMSSWVKLDSYESRSMRIFGTRIDGGRAGMELTVRSNIGAIQMSGRSHTSDGYNSARYPLDALSLRTWHHVVGVLDFVTGDIALYVDGIEQETLGNASPPLYASQEYVYAGATEPDAIGRSPNGSEHFLGALDQVRIHRDALGQTDVSRYLIDDALEHFREADELERPLHARLRAHLEAFGRHREASRDSHAITQLEEFISALEEPALSGFATDDVRDLLSEQAHLALEHYQPIGHLPDEPDDADDPEGPGQPLVGWWTFDDDSGERVFDASGLDHHGTLASGEPVDGYDGVGQALAFDGSGGVTIDDVMGDALHGASAITIAGWVDVHEPPPAGTEGNWVFGTRISGNTAGAEMLMVGDRFRVAGRSHGGEAYQRSEYTFESVGQWVHVAGVLDFAADEIRFFLDGERQEPESTTGATFVADSYQFESATQPDSIARTPAGNATLTGALDDVRVYRQALSDHEIASLAGGGEPEVEAR